MKNLFLCVFFLFFFIHIFGQVIEKGEYRVDYDAGAFFDGSGKIPYTTTGSAYGIKGNRFVFDKFLPCNVYFSDKTFARDKKMNYDCYRDQVIYADSSGKYVLSNEKIDFLEFKLSNKDSTAYFRRIILPERSEVVFMQVLHYGQCKLFKRFSKNLVIKDQQLGYNWDDRYSNEFILRNTYYVIWPGSDKAEILPQKRKAFLPMTDPLEQTMNRYMKDEHINLNNDEDLIRLFKFYDKELNSPKTPDSKVIAGPSESEYIAG